MSRFVARFVSILLCGLIIYNSMGYYWALTTKKLAIRQHKWAMLATMPDEAFEKISIPQSEFNTRIKRLNSREALIDNKLYDIVRERNSKNSTIFFCLFDHEEHSLLVKIRKATQQNSSIPFGNAIKLIDLVIKSALLDTKDIIFHHFSTILKFGNLIIRYQLPVIHIFIPPPEMVSLG